MQLHLLCFIGQAVHCLQCLAQSHNVVNMCATHGMAVWQDICSHRQYNPTTTTHGMSLSAYGFSTACVPWSHTAWHAAKALPAAFQRIFQKQQLCTRAAMYRIMHCTPSRSTADIHVLYNAIHCHLATQQSPSIGIDPRNLLTGSLMNDGSLRLRLRIPIAPIQLFLHDNKVWLCQVMKLRPLPADVMMPTVCCNWLGAWLSHM